MLLAAGRGTRLGVLTANTPKPLLEIAGQPILGHIIASLAAAGIADFVVITGYLGEQVERFCAAMRGVRVATVLQEPLDGTGRAMLMAEPLLKDDDAFVFGWGDVLMDAGNYGRFLDRASTLARARPLLSEREFAEDRCDLLLMVNRVDDPSHGAAVYVDDAMRVTGLVEKPAAGASSTNWNNAGLFAAGHGLFSYLRRLAPSACGELELPAAIAAMIEDGLRVEAAPVRGFWSDIGTPDDLAAARSFYQPARSDA